MIGAKTDPPARLIASLARKARRLAEAAAENRLRERCRDAARWRTPRLLWPIFGQGDD